MTEDYLLLKWGAPKGWKISDPECLALLQKYYDLGESPSAMAQPNTGEHKAVLCDLIDRFSGSISNDWDGKDYTKQEAKDYVNNYGSHS
jgi:hypothetical protein